MITLQDYWMGRNKTHTKELTADIVANATALLVKVNALLSEFRYATKDTEQRKVRSGWRPPEINAATPNAAPNSKHMIGSAVDIADPDGDLDEWCMNNTSTLARMGLWLEHPSATKGWTHLQSLPPKSGNRVFYP